MYAVKQISEFILFAFVSSITNIFYGHNGKKHRISLFDFTTFLKIVQFLPLIRLVGSFTPINFVKYLFILFQVYLSTIITIKAKLNTSNINGL